MNQKVKKNLKITGIAFACLLILMMILPYAFSGKMKTVVLTEGNKMLNAKFDFRSLNINFFKNFPKASITLSDFYIKGSNEFANDTLVKAGEATVAINLFSLFGNSGYDISKISLEDAYVHAIVLENGKVNWDIVKTDTSAVSEKSEKSEPFKLKIKKLTVDNLNIIYEDRQQKMFASVNDLSARCTGDLTSDHTTLKMEAQTKMVTFKMNGIPYLSKATASVKMDLDADLVHNKYTFKDNEIELNAIKTNIDGWVAVVGNGMDMDLKLNTKKIGFKEILSLIPAIYAKDFEHIQTTGSVSLSANAKGIMQGDTLPAFNASMKVRNATFKYPSLPAGVDQININANVTNPGGSADLTVININPFSFRMAGNTFSATATVKTPVSDPDVKASAKGTLNLGMIKQVYPLEEGMQLNGIIFADANMAGRMSYIEKEQNEKFNAGGSLKLTGMKLKMKDMPDVDIQKSTFTFSPKYLLLSETTVKIGKNDLTADCKLENYMGYLLSNKTIKGSLNIKSNYFNLNDFMGNSTTTPEATSKATAPAAKTSSSAVEIPKNIDLNIAANMKKVLFDKMTFNDMNGLILVKDGKVDMKNLSMNTMGGSVIMNGSYSTAASVKSPDLNAGFKMNNLSFSQAFKELDMVQKMAPIFENIKGNFSGNMSIATKLDSEMSPVLNSMQGTGSISTKDISLSGVKVIDKIATAIKNDRLKEMKVKDLKVDFTIKDGRVATKPFDIKFGETVLNLSGSTGLDQTIDYSGKVKLPTSTGAIAKLSTLDLKIGGTFTSPKVSIDTKSMAGQAINAVKGKALNELGKKLGIDLSDAQKQKEALVANAKKAGEKAVAEAQKQADDLVDKVGSNVLKKLAAQKAGESLVKGAQKQADNLVKEAEKEGDKLIEKAKSKQQ